MSATGSSVFRGVQNDREWATLCGSVIGRPDLVDDPRFAHNPERVAHNDDITEVIEAALAGYSADDAVELLDKVGIACARAARAGQAPDVGRWPTPRARRTASRRGGHPAYARGGHRRQGRPHRRLTFVAVNHQISQGGAVVLDERQDIVYRDASPGGTPDSGDGIEIPVAEGDWSIDVTPPLLFRFSALTYNGHRIHYDRDYARDVESYPGLLTHGPLQAMTMAQAARNLWDTTEPVQFDYRLVSPLFDYQGLVVRADVAGDVIRTSARDKFGRQTAQGEMTRLNR